MKNHDRQMYMDAVATVAKTGDSPTVSKVEKIFSNASKASIEDAIRQYRLENTVIAPNWPAPVHATRAA